MNQTAKKKGMQLSLDCKNQIRILHQILFSFRTKIRGSRRVFERLLAVSSTECTKGHPQGLAHYPASTALLILAPLVSRLSPSQTLRLGSKLDVKMEKSRNN
jgi:hypothetical protein